MGYDIPADHHQGLPSQRRAERAPVQAAPKRRVVHKYPLIRLGANPVHMPKGAKLLHVHDQDGVPHVWALVDPDAAQCVRTIVVLGTGQLYTVPGDYIGTAHCGGYVWHAFDESETPF